MISVHPVSQLPVAPSQFIFFFLRKPILVYLSLQKSNSKEIPFLLSTSELVVPNRPAPTRESPKLGRACSCSQGLTKVERKSDYLSCGFRHLLASCLSRSFSEAIPTLKKREKFHPTVQSPQFHRGLVDLNQLATMPQPVV
jgi:hypothetical protein